MKINKKVWLLCTALVISGFSFEYPVFLEYLSYKSINSVQIASILSIQSIGVFVFEYITGVWADKYGYRKILLFSTLFMLVAESIFLLSSNYILYVLAILLISLSVSSKSGADVAFLHDIIEHENSNEIFEKTICNMYSLQILCEIGVLLIGSWVCKYSMKLPFVLTIVFSGIAFIIFSQMPNSRGVNESSAKKIIILSIKLLKESKLLFVICLIAVIVFPAYHIVSYYSQVYMGEIGIAIEYFGFFYIILSAAESLGSKFTKVILNKLSGIKLMLLSAMIIGISLILFRFNNLIISIIGIVCLGISFGFLYMSNTIEINRVATSENRATLISQQHAITKIAQSIILFIAGSSIKIFTVGQMFFGIGILIIVLIVGLIIFGRKYYSLKLRTSKSASAP